MLFSTWWLFYYWVSVDRRMEVEPTKLTPVPAIWHCNQFYVISCFFCLWSFRILTQVLNYIKLFNFYWLLIACFKSCYSRVFSFFAILFCKKKMVWIFINTNMNLETTCYLIHKGACTNLLKQRLLPTTAL